MCCNVCKALEVFHPIISSSIVLFAKKGSHSFFLNRKNFRFQPFCGENFIANLAAAAAAAAEKVSLLNVISTPSWLFSSILQLGGDPSFALVRIFRWWQTWRVEKNSLQVNLRCLSVQDFNESMKTLSINSAQDIAEGRYGPEGGGSCFISSRVWFESEIARLVKIGPNKNWRTFVNIRLLNVYVIVSPISLLL